MNLKIILKDPKYCDGCPCKIPDRDGESLFWFCQYFKIGLEFEYDVDNIIRPQKCIDENGE